MMQNPVFTRFIMECKELWNEFKESEENVSEIPCVISLLNYYLGITSILKEGKKIKKILIKKCFSIENYCVINRFFVELLSINRKPILKTVELSLNSWIFHVLRNKEKNRKYQSNVKNV